MDDDWLKEIDFQNLSGQSAGEINPDQRLENIENKVKNAANFGKKLKEKAKLVPLDKFLPVLNNVNAVSQHNFNVSQNFMLQNRHLQERLYHMTYDVKRLSDERDSCKTKMEENIKKTTLEMKVLSNENEKLTTIMSNYRLENEMLKGVLSEKSDIISKKEEILQRLEREIQQLALEIQTNREKYEKDLNILHQLDLENQEKIHILSLNVNRKEAEISKLQDISTLQKKELENEVKKVSFELQKCQNESSLERKKLEKLEKNNMTQKVELDNMENNYNEKEQRNKNLEKELTKLKEHLEVREKGVKKEYDERIEGIRTENIDKLVNLELRLNQQELKNAELQKNIDELMKEKQTLMTQMEQEIVEKNDMEMKARFAEKERTSLLADFTEVKKRFELLIDDQEKELKNCRMKVWDYENKCDTYQAEIQRLREKEKILSNLSRFKNEQLDTYLKLNIHFNDAYKDISPENIESIQKQTKNEFQSMKSPKKIDDNNELQGIESNNNDILAFTDLDKEWEMINIALADINDKYRSNLDLLQK